MFADSLAWFVLIGWNRWVSVVRRLDHVQRATTLKWHFVRELERERHISPHRAIDIQLIRTLFEMMQHLADKFKLNTDVCLNICWQIHSICFQTGQFQCVFMLLYINMKYICIYLVVFLLMEFHDSIRSKSEIIINLTWSFIFIGFGIWNFLEYKKMLESAVDVETSGNFDWYGFLCIANR